jgi:hypothetical protein
MPNQDRVGCVVVDHDAVVVVVDGDDDDDDDEDDEVDLLG